MNPNFVNTAPAAQNRAAPRDRIVAAACDLFYRDGIRAVGVDAIAAAAGTNKMTLYRHFASKDELVAAYLPGLAGQGEALWGRRGAAALSAEAHLAVRRRMQRSRLRARQRRGRAARARPPGAPGH